MARNSIGLIELTSVAAGFQVCDAMLKTADVELVLSRSICSGKYMVLVRGGVAAVEASVKAGIGTGHFSVIDSFVIPNVHESIFPALSGASKVEALEALGIVESFSVASLIEGAVIRTTSHPASYNSITCLTVLTVSIVSVVVIDWIRIGFVPPIPISPTITSRVRRRL